MTKPFDPKHNNGHCQTRDGRKARILCTDLKTRHGPMIVATSQDADSDYWVVGVYHLTGQPCWTNGDNGTLVNIPEKRKYWVIVSIDAGGNLDALVLTDIDRAAYFASEKKKLGRFIATHEGEYEV